MTIYEKLKANYEKGGLDTLVQREDGAYSIFSTVMPDGGIRFSSWRVSIEECKKWVGNSWDRKRDIEAISEEENWEIVKTIARKSNYEVGDEVRIKETGYVGKIIGTDSNGYEYETIESYYNSKDIEPYFEEEEKEMVTLPTGKKVSMSTVVEAIKSLTKK